MKESQSDKLHLFLHPGNNRINRLTDLTLRFNKWPWAKLLLMPHTLV